MRRSNIEWTDFSGGNLNFVLRGRAKGECEVSPGCAKCYAWRILDRFDSGSEFTTWSDEKLERIRGMKFEEKGEPFRRGPGSRPLAFVVDMGDLFHPRVPNDFIYKAFRVMSERTDVDFQVLTKRAERARLMLAGFDHLPANIWFGVSVEDQRTARERIPHLVYIPARVRFLSVEPMLGQVSLLDGLNPGPAIEREPDNAIDWVICGGESGPGARRMDPYDAVYLYWQCNEAAIPFFMKQGSGPRPGMQGDVPDWLWAVKEFPDSGIRTIRHVGDGGRVLAVDYIDDGLA